jgi:hypothetical protein
MNSIAFHCTFMKMKIGYTDRSKSSVILTNWTQLYWPLDNSLGESIKTLKITDMIRRYWRNLSRNVRKVNWAYDASAEIRLCHGSGCLLPTSHSRNCDSTLATPCGICGRLSGTGKGSPSTSVFPFRYHYVTAPYSSFITDTTQS